MAAADPNALLMKLGANAFVREVERRDEATNLCDQIHDAAYNGNTAAVWSLINREAMSEDNISPDEPHPKDGRTLLHTAIQGIPSTMVPFLLNECYASVDARDSQGRTPLLYACALGSPRMVIRLIAYGADLHTVDNEGCGAILIAAQAGHVNAVVWLFQAGAKVVPAYDGRTALHMAAFAGHASEQVGDCMLEKLLVLGANLEETTDNGFTAMHFAALGNMPHAIHRLWALGE